MVGLSAKAIGRDPFIVVALSVVAGFYTSLAMPGKLGTAEYASASSLLTLVLVTVGFTIVACFSPNNRWLQLLIVGGLTWFLGGIFNILVYGLFPRTGLNKLLSLPLW
jgi:hypothetical protein